MEISDIIAGLALLASAISLVFVWLGHNRANRADIRAKEADERAKKADARAERADERAIKAAEKSEEQERRRLWNRSIEALGALVTSTANDEPTPIRLAEARMALMSLVDELSEEDYPGIGDYMALTHGITAKQYEKSAAAMNGKPKTVDVVSKAHEPVVHWLSAAISNLRRLRNSQQSDNLKKDLAESLNDYRIVYKNLGGVEYSPGMQKGE